MATGPKPDEKICPRCAETIKLDAQVCHHCGHLFSDEDIAAEKNRRQNDTRKGCLVAGGVVGGIVILLSAISAGSHGSGNSTSITGTDTSGQGSENLEDMAKSAASDAIRTPSANWHYDISKDEMRGTTSRYAITTSENSLDLSFPYAGDNFGHLNIRRRAKDGLSVYLTIDKGQLLCSDYSGQSLHVKIDGGPVRTYGCSNASDGTNSVAFFDAPSRILAALKKSKRVVVEAYVYEAGTPQLRFNTAGLAWK